MTKAQGALAPMRRTPRVLAAVVTATALAPMAAFAQGTGIDPET